MFCAAGVVGGPLAGMVVSVELAYLPHDPWI